MEGGVMANIVMIAIPACALFVFGVSDAKAGIHDNKMYMSK
jgi:hypothetical protein